MLMMTLAEPVLAVIITCWNYERFVGHAIDSVLSQQRSDIELVVIDDGSHDGSWDIIERRGVRAYRIDNRGQRGACLYGLDHTTAPFVLFLDADDELKAGSLEAIVARLDADVAKVQFSMSEIDADGRDLGRAFSSVAEFRQREPLLRRIKRSGVYRTPPTSGNVFRRDVCALIRESNYDKAVDGVILFAAPMFGDVVSITKQLGSYRIHDRNDSGLGRRLDPALLQRDMTRFTDRTNHLISIARRMGLEGDFTRPQDMYFYQERAFFNQIAQGYRTSTVELFALLKRFWHETDSRLRAPAYMVFLTLCFLAPPENARSAIEYRLNSGHRTILGMLSRFLGRLSA
jgi:glycosyltransferase involved in cell wall biosynthesis